MILSVRAPRQRRLLLALVGMLIPAGSSLAVETGPIDKGMADFMAKHPECLQFNDQCSICAIIADKLNCSTPKIACIRKDYVCTRPTEVE
jgi:hypothetical protein